MKNQLIKKVAYLGASFIAVVAMFFPYAVIKLDVSGVPEEMKEALLSSAKANGGTNVTFFEKIGDLANTAQADNKFFYLLSSIMLCMSVIAISAILVNAILFLIEGKNIKTSKSLVIVNVVALITFFISLLLGFLFTKMPTGSSLAIGYGSIIYGVAILILLFIEPLFQQINKK